MDKPQTSQSGSGLRPERIVVAKKIFFSSLPPCPADQDRNKFRAMLLDEIIKLLAQFHPDKKACWSQCYEKHSVASIQLGSDEDVAAAISQFNGKVIELAGKLRRIFVEKGTKIKSAVSSPTAATAMQAPRLKPEVFVVSVKASPRPNTDNNFEIEVAVRLDNEPCADAEVLIQFDQRPGGMLVHGKALNSSDIVANTDSSTIVRAKTAAENGAVLLVVKRGAWKACNLKATHPVSGKSARALLYA